VLFYPFFEPTRLPSKKVPRWSLLLRFFRLSKYEKSLSLPSLGSLNSHRRTLPLCVVLITFSYSHLWPNAGSMLLSTEPSKACLIRKPCSTLPLRLDTFGPWRIFPKCPYFEHQSCPYALNLYVCNTRSSFVT
jgi:hypothetical protein